MGKYRSKTLPEGYELAVEGGNRGAYTVYIRMNPQGVEQTASGSSSKGSGEKFLKDGKLYIRVGERVYDITGNKIQ